MNMENVLNVMPEQNEITITAYDVRENYKFNKEDPVCLFIQSIINMKTEVNYHREEARCKELGIEFDKNQVKPGMVEPHAFVMIASLDMFIDWYSKNYTNGLESHVLKRIFEKRDELFFTGLNDTLETKDSYEVIQILDALCVRFYQEIIYAINEYFAADHKIISITADTEKNGYRFKFRNMNIMELDTIKHGKMPINNMEE